MPAVSKKQQKFFGIVRAIQKGEQAPTTPETAKAAADMKKGDVKKFASTKHKGLPEKKKIEEDRQINKIIKQLRKSVKSHKKQADTLEKKVKTFKESAFTNITTGNKVAQTFQHASGATITVDGALGGKMMVPSQVTLDLGFGEKITVDGPTESEFGLAGYTKPLDSKLQKRIADQSVFDMNSRLLASKTASGAPTARITSVSQKGFGGGQGNETNRRGSGFSRDSGIEGGMTYSDVIDRVNAIGEKYGDKIYAIQKKIDALPRDNRPNAPGHPAVPGLVKQINSLIDAQNKEEQGVYDEWDDYNKQPNPDLNLPQDQDIPDDGLPEMPSMAEMEASYEDYRKNNPDFPPFSELASDLELPDIPEEGWTYDEYKEMLNALKDAAARKADPIEKEIMRYSPTGFEGSYKTYLDKYGNRSTPMGLIDARSAIIEALTRAEEALYQKWLAYNKMPDLPSGSPEDADPKLDPTQKFGMRDLGSGPAMTDLGVERKSPSGTFDDDGNYIPPGFEDAIRTDQIGDTQGEFMPSNPQGMRQQGVGKSANDLSRHSPGTSAQQPKTKGGQAGTVNTNTPTGFKRAVAGLADAITGNLTDFDKRGGQTTGISRVVGGVVDTFTNNRTDFDKRGGERLKNTVNAVVKSVWDGSASKSISQNNKNESKPERLKRFFTGVADLYVNTGLRLVSGPFTNISNKLVDLDKRGTLGQGLMSAGTKLPGADKYATAVNHMLSLDKFFKDFSGNKNIKGSTPENPLDTTGSISKNDKNYLESEMSKEFDASFDQTKKLDTGVAPSLRTLTNPNATKSEIDHAKKSLEDSFFTVYAQRAGLVATFGGTGHPVTGKDKALPRVLDVRDRGDYYEVDFGKSYAFRPGGSEPNSPFLEFIGVEPDTIGSDTLSRFGAPIAAKFGIVNDEKFRKKGDPFNLYNSPDMYYKVTIKIYKKKKKKVNESKLSFELIQQFREGLNPDRPKKLKEQKKFKDLMEGMTTSNTFTIVLPSRGNAHLQDIPYSLTGTGEINYGSTLSNTEEDPNTLANDGDEYTALTNMAGMFDAPDPRGVGQMPRTFDIETQQFNGYTNIGGSDAFNNLVPGYKLDSVRYVTLSGVHRNNALDDDPPGGYYPDVSNRGTVRLHFSGVGSPRFMAMKPVDTTEVDTLRVTASRGEFSIRTKAVGGWSVDPRPMIYYWAGDHPDYQPTTLKTGGRASDNKVYDHSNVNGPATSGLNRHRGVQAYREGDGWRPIHMKPNGTLDNSVNPYIIDYERSGDNAVTLPDWARGKSARYMIFQNHSGSTTYSGWTLNSVQFQRKNNISLTVSLDSPEGSNFVRGGIIDGKTTTPKERKKRVEEMLKTSSQYVTGKFGKGFPGQPTVTAGDSTFDTKRFTEETSIKEQKKFKDLMEGMTTSNAYSIVLPARGDIDLDTLQLGATGGDLSYTSGADSPVEGEFTALVNTDPITSVTDPLDVGTNIRSPQNGASLSLDFTDSDVFHTHSDPGDTVPGDDGGTRGAGISGNYNSGYVNDEGATNEDIPLDNFNGEYLPNRVGTHLAFGNHTRLSNAGFPRYAALKAVDTTEMDTLSMNWFARGAVNTDTVDGSPTQGEKVVGGTVTKMNTAGDGVSVFYWAGDKDNASTYAPSVSGSAKINDGWRPINVKPDGTTDNSYSPWLIPHKADVATYGTGTYQKHDSGYPAEVLLNNKITLPPWCRDKNTRFLLHQGRNASGAASANFGITSVRFQRQNAQTISVKLDSPEGSNFVRGGIVDGKATTPEERKKRVADILKTSSQYVTGKFGKGFPGQPTVTAGDSTFDTKRFTEETSIKEQTTFPQMQQRIRDAKEKRREQQKKSEKLYMDTKKKGVKFYDKKGVGRLKDGKKIYD